MINGRPDNLWSDWYHKRDEQTKAQHDQVWEMLEQRESHQCGSYLWCKASWRITDRNSRKRQCSMANSWVLRSKGGKKSIYHTSNMQS